MKVRLDGALTKREMLMFEEKSGVPIDQLGVAMTDPSKPKMRVAMALTWIALRRTNPAATFDEVLDGDYEIEWGDGAKGLPTPPLPPPSASAA